MKKNLLIFSIIFLFTGILFGQSKKECKVSTILYQDTISNLQSSIKKILNSAVNQMSIYNNYIDSLNTNILSLSLEKTSMNISVESIPEFPGGDLGLMNFINKNTKYPAIAKEYNITGKVYVSFIVDKGGSVTNVKIVRGVDKNLDAEAIRVVSSLPKYKPGIQKGKPVRVQFTIPINFTLNSNLSTDK
tara:strand:- start:801 stop:1367 length:567 start_codon:yes stop_codon:yes gene_type:complete